jgi:hypothetical protein
MRGVRLLSGLRVSTIVIEEIRAAQRDGSPHDPAAMEVAAAWALRSLTRVVGDYQMMLRLSAKHL